MNKKNFKKWFIIISAFFLFALFITYGIRLVHFYMKENHKKDENGEVVTTDYFYNVLENTINVSDISGGLYLNGDGYIYKYNATDNYLWYSGHMWRIVSLNDDKTISIIANEPIALITPNYEEKEYIDEFLGEFYQKLDNSLLVKYSYCTDEINDLKTLTCKFKVEKNITNLDLHTYNEIGGQKSFINNGSAFWLNNKSENNYWYIDENGSVALGTENTAHNIRPMITLKSEIELISGDGSLEEPYILKNSENSILKRALVGEYIKYNNELWRILNITENSVQALKMDCLRTDDECLNYEFGKEIEYLNSSIYKYLNKNYFNSLENNDYLVKDKFYVGTYQDYNYKTTMDSNVEEYVGLPKVGEYYIQDNLNSYLITPNTFETVYSINENGNYYLVIPTNEKNIYPIINFDLNLKITEGNGMRNNPYEVSR